MARAFKVPKTREYYYKVAKSPDDKKDKEVKEKDWLKDVIVSAARKNYKVVTVLATSNNLITGELRDMTPEEKYEEDKRRAEFKAKMDERKAKKASSTSHESNGHVESEAQRENTPVEPETVST